MPFQRLRGTHDIYGKDALLFQKVESCAQEVFRRFGFEELRTPILEEKELFTRALGSETDVVQKEMYEFDDRSKTRVALRPEGTAGIVRAYLENNFDKTQGLSKFYYLGPMFRSERPQAGRLRQFHQIGVEQLGTGSPYSDVETIHCLTTFLDKVGVKEYKVKINNLGTFEDRNHYKEALKEFFTPKRESLCEDCRNRLSKNVLRILDCKVETCRKVVSIGPRIDNFLTTESTDHYNRVLESLRLLGIEYTIDSYMVRGLDYYTKTVFEVSQPKLGGQDALAAGGRYDHLIQNFGGDPAGAVGFAIGIERLLMCLSDEMPDVEFRHSFFVATLGDKALKKGLEIVANLRSSGLQASMDYSARSMNSQMRSANKSKVRYVIVIGDTELEKGVFGLKDMKSGVQEEVPLKDIIQKLKEK